MKRPFITALASLLFTGSLLVSSAPGASAAGSAAAPLFKDLPASIQQSKVINVGTSVAYPPYDYNTATNPAVIGFEPDLRAAIAKLLGVLKYRRQVNRKTLGGSSHPDRNAQFEHINAAVIATQAAGQPVISIDTKKKELIGPYKNGGSDYRPEGCPPMLCQALHRA